MNIRKHYDRIGNKILLRWYRWRYTKHIEVALQHAERGDYAAAYKAFAEAKKYHNKACYTLRPRSFHSNQNEASQ